MIWDFFFHSVQRTYYVSYSKIGMDGTSESKESMLVACLDDDLYLSNLCKHYQLEYKSKFFFIYTYNYM